MASERRSTHIDATNADRGDCEEETKEDKNAKNAYRGSSNGYARRQTEEANKCERGQFVTFSRQMGGTKKNTKDAVADAGASVETTMKQTEGHAHGGVDAIKEIAENVAHKAHDVGDAVRSAGENLVRRADTAYHDAVGGARKAADVNDDGVVDEKDVKAVGDKCASKCSIQ